MSRIYIAECPVEGLNYASIFNCNCGILTRRICRCRREKTWSILHESEIRVIIIWFILTGRKVALQNIVQAIFIYVQLHVVFIQQLRLITIITIKGILTDASQSHMWWSSLRAFSFEVESEFPSRALTSGLICQHSKGKAPLYRQFLKRSNPVFLLNFQVTCFLMTKIASLAF